jgi:hypothetical protein
LWKFKNGCVRFEIFEALLMKNLSFVIWRLAYLYIGATAAE